MATLFGQATKKSGGGTLFGGSSSFDSAAVQRQIDNASMRIKDSGYKVEDSGGRNFIERGLNLPEGQNAFFDVLEVLGRPMQGLLNVADKTMYDGTQGAAEAFLRGVSGKDKVRGSQIVEKAGITDGLSKTLFGTGLEMALDPVSYVPGGALVKGAKFAAKPAVSLAKGSLNALENLSPTFKRAMDETIRPAATATKDRLGYMFDPDYKATDTLFGGQSDFLKNTFRQTENQRRFMQDEHTSKILQTAQKTGLDAGEDVGRIMEAPLTQSGDVYKRLSGEGTPYRSILKNDVSDLRARLSKEGITPDEVKQIKTDLKQLRINLQNPEFDTLPRVERELSTNPEIQQAAKNLMDSNAELREWAKNEGVDYNEFEGYMTHVLSAEERKSRKVAKGKPLDRPLPGTNQPNKNILKQRTLAGSAEDVNEALDKKLFEPNAYFATAIGQRRLIDYVSAVSFRRKVLNNHDFAKPYEKGMTLPPNSAVIDTNNYKFIKPDGDLMEDAAMKDIGGQYVVTKAVKEKLDRYKNAMTDEGTKAFLNAFDAAQSGWKRMALFSLPYHLRNDVGAKFNAWVGGMSIPDIAKYAPSADLDVLRAIRGNPSKLYQEYRKQGLGATSQSQVEFMRRGQDPEAAVEKLVKEGSKDLKGKAKDRLNPLRAFETSREFGDFVDQTNRFMVFKWAVDKGKSYDDAAKLVWETQFDYTNITNFEKNVMTRIAPFYRWMRNNLPYQIRQFVNDPRKYANLNKLRLNAQDSAGIDEENVPDWMKESFAIPVSAKDGKGKMLGFNLPVGDLAKLSDPLKMGIDSLTPLIKTPIELGTNFNMFYRNPIEKFEGQEKQMTLFGQNFGVPIKTAYALEQATGQIGRGISGYLQKDEDEDQDKKFRMPKMGISGILKDFDVEKANYYELRDYLKQLQDYINYIEQQEGKKPRTVNEIQKGR